MTEPEHLDPNHLPPWLLEHAVKAGPDAMGWLVAGYLAGVQVGRKSGPCMARLELIPLGVSSSDAHVLPIACELAHGHLGGHSNEKGTRWVAQDSAPLVPHVQGADQPPAHFPG